jgi:hypothetical protein
MPTTSRIWHHAKRQAGPRHARRDQRSDAAADTEAGQKDGQHERERVNGRAEDEREQARPQHFGRERRHARKSDRRVDRPRIDRLHFFGSVSSRRVRRSLCEPQRGAAHDHVERDRRHRRDSHVVLAKQIKAGGQRSDDGAPGIAAVEEAEPRHAFRRRLHPACDGGQRRAHQQRRRQQADRRDNRSKDHAEHAGARPRRIEAADERHDEQHEDADGANRQLHQAVHLQWMVRG